MPMNTEIVGISLYHADFVGMTRRRNEWLFRFTGDLLRRLP
jgi:hypothetical protein